MIFAKIKAENAGNDETRKCAREYGENDDKSKHNTQKSARVIMQLALIMKKKY